MGLAPSSTFVPAAMGAPVSRQLRLALRNGTVGHRRLVWGIRKRYMNRACKNNCRWMAFACLRWRRKSLPGFIPIKRGN